MIPSGKLAWNWKILVLTGKPAINGGNSTSRWICQRVLVCNGLIPDRDGSIFESWMVVQACPDVYCLVDEKRSIRLRSLGPGRADMVVPSNHSISCFTSGHGLVQAILCHLETTPFVIKHGNGTWSFPIVEPSRHGRLSIAIIDYQSLHQQRSGTHRLVWSYLSSIRSAIGWLCQHISR